jgi:hypothetical protein
MKSLITGKATSASSKAMRTSRRASVMLDSVRRASPFSVFMTRARRLVRLSSMADGLLVELRMVDIVIQLLPHILAALLYGALGFHFWNTRWREHEGQCVACPMQAWERIAIAAALLIQAFGLYSALFTDAGMRFSFSFALSLMMWLAVLIYWLESFMARMEGMQPMVLPLAACVQRCRSSSRKFTWWPRQRGRLQAAFPGRHARLQPADAIGCTRFSWASRKTPCTSA